jgi:secreted PhoX family phosphatase
MGTGLFSGTSAQAQTAQRFGFSPIPIQTDGTVHVPEGYTWDPVARWGDPLFSNADGLSQQSAISVDSSDRVFGENTDGMEAFVVGGRQVIAVNHEYVNTKVNLPLTNGEVTSADDVMTLQNMQGVTVMEIAEGPDGWGIVVDSDLNRRMTPQAQRFWAR